MTIMLKQQVPDQVGSTHYSSSSRKGKLTVNFPQHQPSQGYFSTDYGIGSTTFVPRQSRESVESFRSKSSVKLFPRKKQYNVSPAMEYDSGSESDDSLCNSMAYVAPKYSGRAPLRNIDIPIENIDLNKNEQPSTSFTPSVKDRPETAKRRKDEVHTISDSEASDDDTAQPNTSKSLEISKKWLPELNLTLADQEELLDDEMLSDKHMWAAQKLLHKQFPHVKGLQDTCLCQTQYQQSGYGSVQIHHTRGSHWMVSSTLGGDSAIRIYDTLYTTVAPDLKKQFSEMYAQLGGKDGTIPVVNVPVQRQRGFTDCGLFAVAIAYELCLGKNDPEDFVFNQNVMRDHLLQCFQKGRLQSFPHFFKDLHEMEEESLTDVIYV